MKINYPPLVNYRENKIHNESVYFEISFEASQPAPAWPTEHKQMALIT